MPFSKFIIIPVFIAVQAMVLMLLTPYIPGASDALGGQLLTWITFQAWAMYFLGGCQVKMAVKTVLGYIGGIVASIAIFELTGLLGCLGSTFALPVAVLIVVVPVISMEKVPWLDFIPAWFIGAGVFFGVMSHSKPAPGYLEVAIPEVIACVVGLVFGWVTVTFRVKYEAKVGAGASGDAA